MPWHRGISGHGKQIPIKIIFFYHFVIAFGWSDASRHKTHLLGQCHYTVVPRFACCR